MNSEYSARRHKQNENRISGPEMSACNTPVTQRMRVKYQGRSYTKYKYTAVTFDFQFQMIPICIWSCEAWIDFVPLICLAILQFRLLRANQRQIINRSMIHDGFFRTSFYMLNGRCNTFTLRRNQFENVEYFPLILWQNCIDFYLPICRIRIQNAHFTAWMYSCGNAVDWEPFQCCNFLRISYFMTDLMMMMMMPQILKSWKETIVSCNGTPLHHIVRFRKDPHMMQMKCVKVNKMESIRHTVGWPAIALIFVFTRLTRFAWSNCVSSNDDELLLPVAANT